MGGVGIGTCPYVGMGGVGIGACPYVGMGGVGIGACPYVGMGGVGMGGWQAFSQVLTSFSRNGVEGTGHPRFWL